MNDEHGDCFESAFTVMTNMGLKDCVLVHAEVAGEGELEGMTLGHAWVEYEERWAIDLSNGRIIVMLLDRYRRHCQVESIGNEFRYSLQEAFEWADETGHYGAWELDALMLDIEEEE